MAHRERSRKLPTDPLRSRIFARELKLRVLGPPIGSDPEFPKIEKALARRGWPKDKALDNDERDLLNKGKFGAWWNGKNVPQSASRIFFDSHFDGLAHLWIDTHIDKNRLACHLYALDLAFLIRGVKPAASEKVHGEIWSVIRRIHTEWRPRFNSEISIPSVSARAGIDWRRHQMAKRQFKSIRCEPDPRAEIPVGLEKGPISDLSSRASDIVTLYNTLNPSSIHGFMLAYAVRTGLPDPGLMQAWVIDFLTVTVALYALVVRIPESVTGYGAEGVLCIRLFEFFFDEDVGYTDPLWYVNHPIACIAERLEEMMGELDIGVVWRVLAEARFTYFDTLVSASGLSETSLLKFLRNILLHE